ncbi:MAG TPA: ABC transporter substrate-binding protein [Burkholderiales bacterium]|nr:ABC transporter substrate-binding protein [Burkholderiales bacterium]
MAHWLAILAFALAAVAQAQQSATLRVMGFAGSANWPIFVAQDRGLFAARGLKVELTPAPNSTTQMTVLRDAQIDIALTAMDNIVPYPEELFAFLGMNDGGRISLIAAPGIKRLGQLKDRALAVDAIASGYAFVLMEMLARGGLAPGDYLLVSVGGSRERLRALQEGRASGALLNAPTDAAAEAAGFLRLGSSAEVLTHYQGSVGAARRAWARQHGDTLVRYIAAHIAALDWLYAPANHNAALEILERRLGLDPRSAERSYTELLAQGSLARKAALDVDGIRAVLALRSRFAPAPPPSADPARYYDLSYYEKALTR